MCRRWLVYPSDMIWPSLFATTTLLNTLHDHHNPVADVDPLHNHNPIADEALHDHNPATNGWVISRDGFLRRVIVGSFLWYFIPGLVCPALSAFAFMTWIFPRDVIINQVFGMTTGMALFPITFDWSQITGYLGSPLTTPWSAAGNILIGFFLWEWIVCPILHFNNIWQGLYFPLNSYCPDQHHLF